MRTAFSIAWFAILLILVTLSLDVPLFPGLTAKNIFLYGLFALLLLDAAVSLKTAPGPPATSLSLTRLHALILLRIFYAMASLVAVMLASGYALPTEPGFAGMSLVVSRLKTIVIDPYLFLIVFLYAWKPGENATRTVYAVLAMIVVANLLTVVDVLNIPNLGIIHENERTGGRVQGPLGDRNEYGALIVYFLPGIIAAAFSRTGLQRLFFAGGTAISLMVVLMTASRGAVVALTVGSLISFVLLRKHLAPAQVVRFTLIAVVILVLVVAALAGPYGNLLYERFVEQSEGTTLSQAGLSELSSGRVGLWTQALRDMALHPWSFLTGYGWGAFDSTQVSASHNVYVWNLYDLGVIGLLLHVGMWIEILRICIRSLELATIELRALMYSFVFSVNVLLVAQFFVNPYTPTPFIWSYLGVMLALCRSVAAHRARSTVHQYNLHAPKTRSA